MTKVEFPENVLGLRWGSILRALVDVPMLGIRKGFVFPIGFDGRYVRFSGLTWSISGLVDEIRLRVIWEISDEVVDLSDPAVEKDFAEMVEQRTI